MTKIGYARVSTAGQNLDSQTDALTAAGCERIFADKSSGKLASRPQLDAMLDYLRPGDVFVVTRLSRVARSLHHLIGMAADLRERGIDLIVTQQGIDTTTPTGRLAFNMLASIDEYLRELIVEGTNDGLAAARARGRNGGRKPKMTPTRIEQARKMYDSRDYTVEQIAQTFGVTRATIYRHLEPPPVTGSA